MRASHKSLTSKIQVRATDGERARLSDTATTAESLLRPIADIGAAQRNVDAWTCAGRVDRKDRCVHRPANDADQAIRAGAHDIEIAVLV
jgi:hypothetical protein